MANISEILAGIKAKDTKEETTAAEDGAAEAEANAEVDAAIDDAMAAADTEFDDNGNPITADTAAAEEEATLEEETAAAEEEAATAAEEEASAEEDIAEEEAADDSTGFDVEAFLAQVMGESESDPEAMENALAEEGEDETTPAEATGQTYTRDEVANIVSQAVNDAVKELQTIAAPALENEEEATQEEIQSAFEEFLAEGAANTEITDDTINSMVDYIGQNSLPMNSPRSYAEAYHATAPKSVSIEDVPQYVRDAIIAEATQAQAGINQGLPPLITSAKQGAPAVEQTPIKGNIMERAAAIKKAAGQ